MISVPFHTSPSLFHTRARNHAVNPSPRGRAERPSRRERSHANAGRAAQSRITGWGRGRPKADLHQLFLYVSRGTRLAGGEAPRAAAGGAQRRLGGAAARGREAREGQTPAGERGAQERAREGQTRPARQTEPYHTHSRARAGQTRTAQRASTEPPSGGQTRTAERTRAAATPSRPPSNLWVYRFSFRARRKRGADFSTPHDRITNKLMCPRALNQTALGSLPSVALSSVG